MASRSLKFKVSGDTVDAQGAAESLAAKLQGLDTKALGANERMDQMNTLAGKLAKTMGIETADKLQRNVQVLQELKTAFEQAHKPASDMEKVSAALSDAQAKLNTALNPSFWSQHGTAITSAASALGGFAVRLGIDAVKAFSESEVAGAQLNSVLESTQYAAGLGSSEINKMATELSGLTGIDDEAIISAQSMLLTFTNIGKEAFPSATRAVLDMATAMNSGMTPSAEQLKTTSIQLGKALNDPVTGVTALKKVGVSLDANQKELIKNMMAHNDLAGAQKIILAEVTKEYGGSAQAIGDTFTGALGKANVELGNMKEALGEKLAGPLKSIISTYPALTAGVMGLSESMGGFSGIMMGMAQIKFMSPGAWSALSGALSACISPITLVTAGLAGLTAAAIAWYSAMRENEVQSDKLNSKITELAAKLASEGVPQAMNYVKALNSTGGQAEVIYQKLKQLESQHLATNKKTQEAKEKQEAMSKSLGELKEKLDAEREAMRFSQDMTDDLKESSSALNTGIKNLGISFGTDLAKNGLDVAHKAMDDYNQSVLDSDPALSTLKTNLDFAYISLQDLTNLMVPAKDNTVAVEDAYKALGLTSPSTMEQMKGDALSAFETIKTKLEAEGAPPDQIQKIWKATMDKMGSDTKETFWTHQESIVNTIDRANQQIVTGFSGALTDLILTGNKEDFLQSLKSMAMGWAQQLLDAFILNGIKKIIGWITGEGGQAGSLFGALDSLGGKVDQTSGNITGMFGSIGTKFDNLMAKITTAMAGAGLMIGGWSTEGAAGGAMAGAGGALAGLSIAQLLSVSAWAGPIGAAIGGAIGVIGWLITNRGREKVQDTEITEKGYKQIWDLYSQYQAAGLGDPGVETGLRKDTLITGISIWNEMAKSYKRKESYNTQRAGILGFIDSVNKVYNERFFNSLKQYPDFQGSTHDQSLPIQPMARGGIITRPTMALMGEAGPEAVVPLNQSPGIGNVYITVERVETNDPKKLVDGLVDLARVNRWGTRVRLREALAL